MATSWAGTCTGRGFFLQPATARKSTQITASTRMDLLASHPQPRLSRWRRLKSGKNDTLPSRRNSESFEHTREATPVLTGGRTLPDDKVVNALSIARYDATYHSNLSAALLNSSLFQFISKCAAARLIEVPSEVRIPKEQLSPLSHWLHRRESRNDRVRFQKATIPVTLFADTETPYS